MKMVTKEIEGRRCGEILEEEEEGDKGKKKMAEEEE